jgi:hypothetical protein
MKSNSKWMLAIFVLVSSFGCFVPDPNTNQAGEDELTSLELDRPVDQAQIKFEDVIYVPIYSDIYVDEQNQNSQLSATLSIRNTSLSDSLIISQIDYFNTIGTLVRSFISKPISLPPLGTVNYVIEKQDETGGSGANFIVALSATNPDIKPLVQAIMIGEDGNKGFAFSMDGYSIKQ